jgi:CCR4-NOT transcription complex subunit 7/8
MVESTTKSMSKAANTGAGRFKAPNGKMVEIRDVWRDNLDEEMAIIRKVVEKFPYVAMDTEFPGVVARPITDQYSHDYQYQTLRCNVDLLKIIQLGVAFENERGEHPEGCVAWQFNFRFNLQEDMYAQDSIDLLKDAGIDFARHATEGIDVQYFGEVMITSGIVLTDDVRWVSFHSGYDFGYLLKLLTCSALPANEGEFFELLKLYFPYIYDIKYMVNGLDGLHGGLQKIADHLTVARIGPMHQAGSDALLTCDTFFKLCDQLGGAAAVERSDQKYVNELFGLGGNCTVYRPPPQEAPHPDDDGDF